MKTTKQKKKEFKALIRGLEEQGLELISTGHEFSFDFSQTLRKVPTDTNDIEMEPTGNKMILVGICPKYFLGVVNVYFQNISEQFQD